MVGHAHSHDEGAHHHHDGCDGHDHSHAPKVTEQNRKRVGIAAILTGLFMVAEVAGGLISGSLALLADAAHMMTDFAALAMAWAAFQIARKPANSRFPYGYDRVSILVAFINGLTLFLVAGWIVWEAFVRFLSPGDILAGPMLYVAIAGLIVNLIVFKILMGADQENLNIRGAVLHVLGDLLGSVAAIAAAVIILTTGWVAADPILSVLVALLILRSAWALIKASAHILLQGAPENIDLIQTDLLSNISELESLSDLRVWSMTNHTVILTLKAQVASDTSLETARKAITCRLSKEFNIEDVTLDMTHAP